MTRSTRIASIAFVALLLGSPSKAQSALADTVGLEDLDGTEIIDSTAPWDLDAPERSAGCLSLWTAEQDAQSAIGVAEGVADQGPPLPPVPTGLTSANARLFSDPERRSPLRVRASDGQFTPTGFQVLDNNRLSIEGTFSSGGSSYRAFVAPEDAGLPNLVADRARQSVELRLSAVRARTGVTAARVAAERCERDAGYRWRKERTEGSGYYLTRASRSATVRDGTESYSPRVFDVQARGRGLRRTGVRARRRGLGHFQRWHSRWVDLRRRARRHR